MDLQCLNKKDITLDILPSVYQIIHPDIRDINIQMFNAWEKVLFLKALEFMVIFNIKIAITESSNDAFFHYLQKSFIPKFEPNITSLVVYGIEKPPKGYQEDKHKISEKVNQLPMRQSTQILLMQNYERVKQAMLIGLDTE